MSDTRTIATLNRMLFTVYRSLPIYLFEGAGAPALREQDDRAWRVVSEIAKYQQQMTERIAEFILERKGSSYPGEVPVEFTDLNFLSLPYLVMELDFYQRQDIETLESCVSELSGDAEAQALAQEALGSARAHLEQLEGLIKQPA